MKTQKPIYQDFKVWIQDTDGSERLGGTIWAKGKGHAIAQYCRRGEKLKILSVEAVSV
jgi:1,2-phenylacetyl-CoA epoxidase PaaB subunit